MRCLTRNFPNKHHLACKQSVFRLLIGNSRATIQHTLINFALFSGCR